MDNVCVILCHPVDIALYAALHAYRCLYLCVISGVCVQRALKATHVRSTSMTAKTTTVRTTPPASMESTTTLACAHQNIQVTFPLRFPRSNVLSLMIANKEIWNFLLFPTVIMISNLSLRILFVHHYFNMVNDSKYHNTYRR